MPFLYESRQHRRTSRESMDCAVMLQELVNMGVDNILTFDAHDHELTMLFLFTVLSQLCQHISSLKIF